jgi:hypothetical protein
MSEILIDEIVTQKVLLLDNEQVKKNIIINSINSELLIGAESITISDDCKKVTIKKCK